MPKSPSVAAGRSAFAERRWHDAYVALSESARNDALDVEDLERLVTAAHLSGNDDEALPVLEHAHRAMADAGATLAAARAAFWIGMRLLVRGDFARGGGWIARTQRLVDDAGKDCVERGYLILPAALGMLQHDPDAAREMFEEMGRYAARFHDRDLDALSLLGRGDALIGAGRAAEGTMLLDEAMVAVVGGELSPFVTGVVYCAVINTLYEGFDIRRASEWTAALTAWCRSQPQLVPFRGQCLVHRSQIMQLAGSWPEAADAAEEACEALQRPPSHPAVGAAYYQRAELARLRGDLRAAEELYKQASRHGHTAQPGLALVRLAQGDVESADAGIRRCLSETTGLHNRARILPAFAEIVLASDDVDAARAAADELDGIAGASGVALLQALAATAHARVALADGSGTALALLKGAWSAWQSLDVPYEAARVRVLLGEAYRRVGDDEGAEMELDAARRVFEQIGATLDLAAVDEGSRKDVPEAAGGLTARELQVLRLVAAGKTNRAIAGDLVISQKTVARHVANIFTKLGLSSRAGATAYAYENSLL